MSFPKRHVVYTTDHDTQKRLEKLQVATETVEKVVKEQEQRRAAAREQQRKSRPIAGTDAPTWDDDQATVNEEPGTHRDNPNEGDDPESPDTDDETFGRKTLKAETKTERPTKPAAASPPTRFDSLPYRQSNQPDQGFYKQSPALEGPKSQRQTRLRSDGQPARGSSLNVSSPPIEVPGKKNRHHVGYDSPETYKGAVDSYSGSINRPPTNLRRTTRPVDPSFAAQQTDRDYEEEDFLDPLEWRQYKREKAHYQEKARKRREQQPEEQEYSEEEAPRRLRRPSSNAKPSSGRHAKNYDLVAPKRSSHGSKKYHDDDRTPRTEQTERTERTERTETRPEDAEDRRSRRHREPNASTVISKSGKRGDQDYFTDSDR